MLDFTNTTVDQLTERLRARSLDVTAISENCLFYDGDHWQAGNGWIGQRPDITDANYASVMAQIQTGFVSRNAIKEVVSRHISGVLGREPAWDYVLRRPLAEQRDKDGALLRGDNGQARREQPTVAEEALLREADTEMTAWWDQRKPFGVVREAAVSLVLGGCSVLRVYVPRGLRDNNGKVQRTKLADALTALRVHSPPVTAAGIVVDVDTEAEYGVYLFKRGNESYAEVSYLNDSGQTIIRIIKSDGTFEESDPLDLGGHLTIFELRRDILITAQVRQLQRALNLANTKMLRNVNVAGDLERTLFNAEPPMRETDEIDPATGKKKRVPAAFRTGAGVTAFVQGTAIRNEQGEIISRENPSISYRDPVDVSTFIATKLSEYADILGECQQTHALISGDATASGKSREQARSEYEGSLDVTKGVLDGALRWLLEVVLYHGSGIASQRRRFAGLRVEANCHADSGPLSAEERRANRDDFDKGLLSSETAMSRNGVDDPDAENERIRSEGDKTADDLKLWEVVETATRAGVPLAFYLAEELGWEPSKIAQLEQALEEQQIASAERLARTLNRE